MTERDRRRKKQEKGENKYVRKNRSDGLVAAGRERSCASMRGGGGSGRRAEVELEDTEVNSNEINIYNLKKKKSTFKSKRMNK